MRRPLPLRVRRPARSTSSPPAGSLLLGGYGLLRLTEIPGGAKVLIWIVAAALLHDLVALPAYSLLLRVARGAADKAFEGRGAATSRRSTPSASRRASRCCCSSATCR